MTDDEHRGEPQANLTLEQRVQSAAKLETEGRFAEATEVYEGLLQLKPESPEIHYLLGYSHFRNRHFEEARPALEMAVALKPEYPEAWNVLGLTLKELGRLEEALEAIAHAARVPGQVEALCNLGDVMLLLGRKASAIQVYQLVLSVKPDHLSALVNLGAALMTTCSYRESEQVSRRALELAPESANALNNLGNALAELDRPEEAIEAYLRSLKIRPKQAEIICNLGNAHMKLNRLGEAISFYREAQRIAPDLHEAVFFEGLAWLRLGNFQEGWWRYEYRLKAKNYKAHGHYSKPALKPDDDLSGKTLLLHADQGLGDNLQFIRFLPELQARCARLIVELPESLHRLVADSFPGVCVLPEESGTEDYDYHCLLMSLPYVLKVTFKTAARGQSYLEVSETRTGVWRDRFSNLLGPRVGIVWAGHPDNVMDHRRSVPLQTLRSLFDGFQGTVIRLQKECPQTDEAVLAEWGELQQPIPEGTDFAELAAAVSALDLVITVDTSVAHLAGALGKKTWLLLAFAPDWRWLTTGTDTPWYPNTRLFRQPSPGDWNSVQTELRKELALLR